MPWRIAVVVFLSVLSGAFVSASESARTPGAPAAAMTEPLDPELETLLSTLAASPWERTLTLTLASGYRDNLLLSPFAPIGRMFGQAKLEAFAWRLPVNHWEAVAYLDANVLRYFSPPPETGGEQQWFGHGELRWLPADAWRFALSADGYYQDMVMDLSETDAARQIIAARTRGELLTATVRVLLPVGFSFSPAVQVHRSTYREFPGDYDEAKAGARLEWKKIQYLTISTAWFERTRSYLQRPQFTAGGRALPGTKLHFRQREGELKATGEWTARGRWTATAAISGLENRDHASGYFDYREKRGRLELAWEPDAWRVSVSGDAKRRDYLVQTAGIGIAPPPRIADEFETSGRLERRWGKTWVTFVEENWERSRYNEIDFNYRANTSTIGVQRVF